MGDPYLCPQGRILQEVEEKRNSYDVIVLTATTEQERTVDGPEVSTKRSQLSGPSIQKTMTIDQKLNNLIDVPTRRECVGCGMESRFNDRE